MAFATCPLGGGAAPGGARAAFGIASTLCEARAPLQAAQRPAGVECIASRLLDYSPVEFAEDAGNAFGGGVQSPDLRAASDVARYSLLVEELPKRKGEARDVGGGQFNR
eukprot:tig00020965_g16880.t1